MQHRSASARPGKRNTLWGLSLRSPFSDHRLVALSGDVMTDSTGGRHIVVGVSDWPVDSDAQIILLEMIRDLQAIGMTGHLTPVILERQPTETAQETYSFGRVVRNDGVAVRVRRFTSSEREEPQFGFIDEDGNEHIVVGKDDARIAYMNAISFADQNDENSIDAGRLVVKDELDASLNRHRFDAAVVRLASAGICGVVSFVEDVTDFGVSDYERRHVFVRLETPNGIRLDYCEAYIDGVLARRKVSNGNQFHSFDDRHIDLASGAASERELYRRLFNEVAALVAS